MYGTCTSNIAMDPFDVMTNVSSLFLIMLAFKATCQRLEISSDDSTKLCSEMFLSGSSQCIYEIQQNTFHFDMK